MNFSGSPALFRACILAGTCLTLSSCHYGNGGYGYGYGSYGYGYGGHGDGYGYGHRPFYSGYRHSGYSRYGHGYDNYRGGHSEDRGSRPDQKHRDNAHKIVGGSVGSKTRPTGYHSNSWFKSKGYDTSQLALRHEDGRVHKGSRYSSTKSSRSSASSSARSSGSHKKTSGTHSKKSGGGNRSRGGSGKSGHKKK